QVIGAADRTGRLAQVFEAPAILLFDRLADALRAVVVDQELEAGLGARQAIAQVGAPHVEDCLRDGQRLLLRHAHRQSARYARRGLHATADAQREAVATILPRPDEHDAVDLGRIALSRAGRDGDLVFARQVKVVALGQKVADELVELRPTVEQLVGVEAGDRAAGNVAHAVAAAA